MANDAKIEKLVKLLIRKTTEGALVWASSIAPKSLYLGTDHVVDEYFETEFKKQPIAVFRRRYQTFDIDHEVMYWTSMDCLAFITKEGDIWETGDQSYQIATLFRVAKESAVRVDDILDRLLRE